jgi:lysophospholipase L1-like esterase
MSFDLMGLTSNTRSMKMTFVLLFTILMMTASLTGCIGQVEEQESPGWLFIGDSDIEGWDTSQFVSSTNIGDGGSLCSDALSSIDEVLEQYTPIHVVIVCGENDLSEDRTVEETFEDFQAIIHKIIGSGASVTYMGTKPEPGTTELHDQYRDYDGRIQDFAVNLANNSNAPLNVVDVYQGFEDIGNPSSLYQDDELHLSLEGYEYWDQWLVQVSNDSGCIIWQSQECRVGIE